MPFRHTRPQRGHGWLSFGRPVAAGVFAVALVAVPAAPADTFSWTGAASPSWNNAGNWTGGGGTGIPGGGAAPPDTVQFDAFSTANLSTVNDIPGSLTLAAINVGAVPAGAPVSIGGNGFTLNGNNGSPNIGIDLSTAGLTQSLTIALGANQTINLGASQNWRFIASATPNTATQNLTINSPITGAAGVDLSYGVTNIGVGTTTSGTVQLLAPNTYAGNTTLGGPNYTYLLGTNSPFGTGTVTSNSFNSAPRLKTAGNITVSNNWRWSSGFMYTADSTGSLTFTGGTITFADAGSGQLNRLINNVSNSLITVNDNIVTSGTGDAQAKTFQITTNPGNVVINGVISDGPVVSTSTTKSGPGTATFNNTGNSFGGTVIIQQGVLEATLLADAGTNSSIGTGSLTPEIRLGNAATTGTLRYIGSTNSATNRQLRLIGTTGGGGVENNGTGTVSFTNATFGAAGAGAKTFTLSGTNTGLNTIAGAINQNSATNNTSLVKSGNGTWQLTGANTYTGTTQVNGGTLLINNAAGIGPTAGPVTVAGGTTAGGPFGTLGGSGGIGPAVTVQAGTGGGSNAAIAPGAATGVSIGTLNLGGGLTLPGTYTADVQSAPNLNDLIAVTGNLDLTGGTLNLPLTNTYDPPANNTSYTVLTYSGALTGQFASVLNQPAGYNVVYTTPGQVNLSPTPVPEPAFLLSACGLAGVAAWRRNRRGRPV